MNQQDKDKQQLRPSPDFKVGEIVEYAGLIGKVVSTNYHNTHPILVDFNSGEWEAFTKEGCLYGEDVELFRLEESDKPQQASVEDTNKAPSLQTFTHIAEWIAKTAQFTEGGWYVGSGLLQSRLTTEELHLLYLYRGLEEGI